ncbi:MAG TPA: GNAT family N-acetyltransferase [Kofleriaceae bacterium]
MTFTFLDPGELRDGELSLVLALKLPADPIKNWVPCYEFEIRRDDVRIGRVGFRVGPIAELYLPGHIGYAIDEAARGHRYAERAVRTLLPFVARHMAEAWLTCDEANLASRKTIERLGAELFEICDLPPSHEHYVLGVRRWCRYRLQNGMSSSGPPPPPPP